MLNIVKDRSRGSEKKPGKRIRLGIVVVIVSVQRVYLPMNQHVSWGIAPCHRSIRLQACDRHSRPLRAFLKHVLIGGSCLELHSLMEA